MKNSQVLTKPSISQIHRKRRSSGPLSNPQLKSSLTHNVQSFQTASTTSRVIGTSSSPWLEPQRLLFVQCGVILILRWPRKFVLKAGMIMPSPKTCFKITPADWKDLTQLRDGTNLYFNVVLMKQLLWKIQQELVQMAKNLETQCPLSQKSSLMKTF